MDSRSRALFTGAAAVIALSVFGLVPVVGACVSCLALVSGGLVAVWDYTRREQVTIPGGEGATMGALAGCLAFAISTGLMLLVWLAAGMPNLADVILPRLEAQVSQQGRASPEQVDQMMGFYESILTNPALLIGVSLAGLVLQVIGGALGGLIGAAAFKKGGDLRPEQPY